MPYRILKPLYLVSPHEEPGCAKLESIETSSLPQEQVLTEDYWQRVFNEMGLFQGADLRTYKAQIAERTSLENQWLQRYSNENKLNEVNLVALETYCIELYYLEVSAIDDNWRTVKNSAEFMKNYLLKRGFSEKAIQTTLINLIS